MVCFSEYPKLASSLAGNMLTELIQEALQIDDREMPVLIRVFGGGESGWQIGPFTRAVAPILKTGRVRCEIMHVKHIKELCWSPSDFIDWLLESDVHFIITHIHQGIKSWNCEELLHELGRLYNHAGFPYGQQLFCPVFTQHKLKYLMCLPPFMRTPTLAIELHLETNQRNKRQVELIDFLRNQTEGNGWVVKLPFVTNREGIQFCKTPQRVIEMIGSLQRNFIGRIPYCMVQPCLKNR